ncbi:polyprotein [Lettuce mottle virus]|nr:polyprotein [Lettuce mottle virus]
MMNLPEHDVSNPTQIAINAARGEYQAIEEFAFSAYNFVDVAEMEETNGNATKTLANTIKRRAAAMLGVSRAFKETEQVLSVERCRVKEISEHEEIIATTFEPLRDMKTPSKTTQGKDDPTLGKHRAKYNYMAIDSMRVSISSLLHQGDERECIMYVCDRRISDPFLGALALIGFPLKGMSTHVYKTGRIVCFSKHEAIAPEHIQLYVYIKGAKLLRKDNAPFALNMKTSFIFGNNAENLLKHDTTMDTDGNLISFLTQNQDIFGWLETAQGGGYTPLKRQEGCSSHSNRSSLMKAWATPRGNISQRFSGSTIPRSVQPGEESTDVHGATLHVGNARDDLGRLNIGVSRAGVSSTDMDERLHSVVDFVQDSEIQPITANLEAFMSEPNVAASVETFERQFTRPIYVDTVEWKSTHDVGAEVFALENPGDFMGTPSLFGQFVKRAFCFKADFEVNIMISGNEAFSGAIKVCIDHMRRLYEAGRDDVQVYQSMPGETLHASDTNGLKFLLPFESIHNMISAHDLGSHNALSRVSFRVIAKLAHAQQTAPTMHMTIQVYVKNLSAKHAMWKSLETTFPVSQGTPLPSVVGNRYGSLNTSSNSMGPAEIRSIVTQKALIGTATISSETKLRIIVATFAIHPMSSRTESGILKLSQLAALSAMFSYWRGSLIVHFEMTCSSATRGKVLFSITPKGGAEMKGAQALHLGMGAEFDIGTAISRKFEIPFVSTDDWESLGDRGLMSAFEGVWDCPVAKIIVLHPINSIGATTPAVDIRCYISPGRDFELRGRRHLGLRTSLRPLSLGTAQNRHLQEGSSFTLMGAMDVNSIESSCIIQIPCAPWYSKDSIDYALLQNPLHWASRFFTFWKGDLSFRIVIKEGDELGPNWQAPITMWHNSQATFDKCKITKVEGKTLSKEGYPSEKLSLKQMNTMEITAHDDQRYRWRLCKLHDTQDSALEGSSTKYTGHPPLSSHTGVVFVKFPKGGFKAKVKIYSKAEANFQYHLSGGVPSLKLDKLRPYSSPFYPNGKPSVLGHNSQLLVGRAQASLSFPSFITQRYTHSAPPTLDSPSSASSSTVETGAETLVEASKRKLSELFSMVGAKIKEALSSLFLSVSKSVVCSLISSMIDKALSIFSDVFSKIAAAFKDMLATPITSLILGLSFTAIACYSALKFASATVPDSLGHFKTLVTAVSVALSVIYWPTALSTILMNLEKLFSTIEESCQAVHEYFFPNSVGHQPSSSDYPATSCTTSGVNPDELKDGKAQGTSDCVIGLVGLAAYIRLCVTICNALGANYMDPFLPKNMEKNLKSVSGISQGIKTLIDFKDYLYRVIMGNLMPSSSYTAVSKEVGFDLKEWFEDVERLTLHENRYHDLNNEHKIWEIRQAYSKGVVVMGVLSRVEMVHLARMCERTFKLAKELLDETHRVKGVSGVRLDPFHLSLFGSPGVGKSFVMGRLLEDTLDLMGEPMADRSYSKTPNEEYWSGYYGQTAVKCDDLGQDLSKGFSPTYNQIIQMKTNNPFIVPMADLANKGRTFTSKYIFSTTNVRDCGSKHGLADPDAFLRRRDLLVHVTTDGPLIHGQVSHMRFTVLDPLNPSERDTRFPENMIYADFLCLCIFEMTQYFRKQEKVLETLRGKSLGSMNTTDEIRSVLGLLDPDLERKVREVMEESFVDATDEPLVDAGMEVTREDIERGLKPGRAQANSFSSYQNDFDGNPLPKPFCKLFAKYREGFARDKKKVLTDLEIDEFGAFLSMGDFVSLNPGKLDSKLVGLAKPIHREFFDYIFHERLLFVVKEDFLHPFTMTTAAMINRLVHATHYEIVDGNEVMKLEDEYDRMAYQSLSIPEKTAYHLMLACIRAKTLKSAGWRTSLSTWFEWVKQTCANIIDSLTPTVKFLLMLATSCGAMFLAFKGVQGVVGAIRFAFGNLPSDEDYIQMSLDSLTALGKKGKGKQRPSFGSGDELTARIERMISRSALATGVSQGGRTRHETQNLLLQRMGHLRNEETGVALVAINIGNGCILTPLHVFQMAEEDDMLVFNWQGEKFFFVFTKDKVTQVGELDLCVINTHSVPKRDMVLSIFMDEKELEAFSDIKCSYVCGPYLGETGAHVEDDLVAIRAKQFKYTVGSQMFISVQGWAVAHTTLEGQCGSVLVSHDEAVNGKVFGMLVAGTTDQRGNKVGTYVPVTKQMIVRALGKTCELKQGAATSSICGVHIDPDLNVALGLEEKLTSEALDGRLGIFAEGTQFGAIHVVGRTKPAASVRTATKTSIIPSLIQHTLPRTPLTEPAILSAEDPRLEGKLFDPLIDGIKKYEHQAKPFREEWRKKILDTFGEEMGDWETQMVRANFQNKEPSIDEIINGIDGAEYYESINMSTSEGYPLILKRPSDADGKKWLFDFDENTGKYRMANSDLIRNYEAYGAALSKLHPIPLICIESPKDERRALKKIYTEPKTRLFSILPVEFNMHARRLYLDFNVVTMANRHKHGIMVGINPHSREWTELALGLASFSPVGFNGDFANFDGMFHPDAFEMVCDLANKFYGDSRGAERKCLTEALTNRLSLVKGSVLSIGGGGPSGFPMTVIFNSFINLFYLQAAWIQLAKEHGRDDIAHPCFYKKFVRAYVYGDDNIVSIKEEVISWYNLCTVSSFLKDAFGVTMTDGEKNQAHLAKPYGNILEFDFLKRGFLADTQIPSLFHAPLNRTSIEEQVYWIRKGGDAAELLQANAENALYEASHHGRDYFDELRSVVREAYRRICKDVVLPTYIMCRQRWLTTDLGEVSTNSIPSKVNILVSAQRNTFRGAAAQRYGGTSVRTLDFKQEKDSLGGTRIVGPMQEIQRGVYIGSNKEVFSKYSQSHFSLILDNTLSLGQRKYGRKHGISSLNKPNFSYLMEAVPVVCSAWPSTMVAVDIHGGALALVSMLCLLHACKMIDTNTFCKTIRTYIGRNGDKAIKEYFLFMETPASEELKKAIEVFSLHERKVQEGFSARALAREGGFLLGDDLTLPIKLAECTTTDSSSQSSEESYLSDEKLNPEDFEVDIIN